MVSVYGVMTYERKERIWQLWRQGRPMIDIARDIVKPPATVYSYLLYHGGIEPRKRIRRAASLSLEERKTIYRGLVSGGSIRSLAKEIARSPSTVCREIARNGGGQRYRACNAETTFLKRSRRPKSLLLSKNLALRSIVTEKLEADWSPEQISGWLKTRHPREGGTCAKVRTLPQVQSRRNWNRVANWRFVVLFSLDESDPYPNLRGQCIAMSPVTSGCAWAFPYSLNNSHRKTRNK